MEILRHAILLVFSVIKKAIKSSGVDISIGSVHEIKLKHVRTYEHVIISH